MFGLFLDQEEFLILHIPMLLIHRFKFILIYGTVRTKPTVG